MAYKIAVTGGIGSGKSVALSVAKEFKFKCFSCDTIARTLYRDQNMRNKIRELFGDAPFSSDGRVLRKRLAKIVFSDRNELLKLNALTHTAIINKLNDLMSAVRGVCVVEVPLLFECKMENDFDMVIVVMRDLDSRIKAVCERDGVKEEDVQKRIKNQFDYAKLDKNAHTIICNDGSFEELKDKLRCVFEKVKKQNS